MTDTAWTLEHHEPPADAIHAGLRDCLRRYAEQAMGRTNDRREWAWVARGPEGRLIGGLTAELSWSWLYIRLLWVNQPWRGHGIGRGLMQAAEGKARGAGAIAAMVDTADFQAPTFYEKLGYTVFGTVADLPPGHTNYYLLKRFEA